MNFKSLLLGAALCLAFGSQSFAAKPTTTGGSGGKTSNTSAKACIDPILQQMKTLRAQIKTDCKQDKTSTACVSDKEQLSTLRDQLKACK